MSAKNVFGRQLQGRYWEKIQNKNSFDLNFELPRRKKKAREISLGATFFCFALLPRSPDSSNPSHSPNSSLNYLRAPAYCPNRLAELSRPLTPAASRGPIHSHNSPTWPPMISFALRVCLSSCLFLALLGEAWSMLGSSQKHWAPVPSQPSTCQVNTK